MATEPLPDVVKDPRGLDPFHGIGHGIEPGDGWKIKGIYLKLTI
jgi:hypothetical protein